MGYIIFGRKKGKESSKRIKNIGDGYLVKNKYQGLTRLTLKRQEGIMFQQREDQDVSSSCYS